MGACLSRKRRSSSPPPPPPLLNNVPLSAVIEAAREDPPELIVNKNLVTEEEEVKEDEKKQVAEEESPGKKEAFVVKHRKSHDRERPSGSKEEENKVSVSCGTENGSNVVVRSSSCTKEEVDAILIQCGRLSRNNSSATPAASSARKYAGSKRSFDLDSDRDAVDFESAKKATEEEIEGDRRQRHRRQTHSSPRRRTPSRERDSGGSGRRVSRSPAKRSSSNCSKVRPGKLVSVPATVESQTTKRVSVKRNAGEAAAMRAVESPRAQSPARTHSPARRGGFNENNQPSLSRSNSRKAEQSPYRRNPLAEIDSNKPNNGNTTNRKTQVHNAVKEAGQVQKSNKVAASAGDAKSRPQTPTRSRIARRSRDFDFNPEHTANPNPSYTALLLDDIQSFHQKNTSTNTNADQSDSFPVPACLSKACSILEAVADLNSTTSSNRSCTFSGIAAPKLGNGSSSIVESEVEVRDDLRDPSMHKYVTVRRGGDDLDGQESSGSNSFVGGSHHWGYSRAPNSADSTDRWSSRSSAREDERSPLGFQKLVISETGLKGERTANGRAVVAVASL